MKSNFLFTFFVVFFITNSYANEALSFDESNNKMWSNASSGYKEIPQEKVLHTSTSPENIPVEKAKIPLPPSNEVNVYDTILNVLNYAPSLQSIQENRTSLEYEVKKARSEYYPSLDITGEYGYGYESTESSRLGNNGKSPSGTYRPTGGGSVTLTQILWNGMAISNSVDFNIFKVESLDHRIYDNATYLALEGLIAHMDILRTEQVLVFTREYVRIHEEVLEQQKKITRSGISTSVEVTQAEGRLVRAIADLKNAENAHRLAINNYEILTGNKVPTKLLKVPLPLQKLLSPEEIIEVAIAKNPKILAYHSDYKASEKEVKIAEAGYHPEITFSIGADYNDPAINSSGPTEYTFTQSATIGIEWNLFNGFATKNSILSAKAKTRMARKDILVAIDSIKYEIIDTYDNLINSRELEIIYTDARKHNRQTRDNYLEQFKFGTRSLLNVLDAETELYNTQVQLSTVSANAIVNAWRLLALQGTLLDECSLKYEDFEKSLGEY